MEQKDFKIALMSNAPFSPSGYGVQSQGMIFDWAKTYNARMICNYGLEGSKLGLNNVIHYPKLPGDNHGSKTSALIFANWNPHIFITLYDIWMGAYIHDNPNSPIGVSPIHPYWIPIVMVDHDPIPEGTLISAKAAYKVVTPSLFGIEQFKKHDIDAQLIPFGVDVDTFKPLTEEERGECKEKLNNRSLVFNLQKNTTITKDDFLIVMNSANKDPYRKDFPRALTALQIFLQNNPDAQKDTRMYIHSWMRQSRDIPHCAKVLYVDQYCRGTADYHNLCGVPPQILNEIYNAGDVFLHTSQGGGFEIPLLEASSAGVPSIAQDFVGFKELIRDHGWLIKPKTKYFTQLDGLQAIADEYEIADAIEDAYNHPDKRKKMGNKARKFALNFKWSIINREWHKVFDEIIDEISYKPLSVRQL